MKIPLDMKILIDWIKYFLFYIWRKPTVFEQKPYNYTSSNYKQIIDWQTRQKKELGIMENQQSTTIGKIGIEKAKKIHKWVRNNIRYVSDQSQYGKADYWETAKEVLNKNQADCEGLSILRWKMLRDAGFPEDKIGIALTKNHAFCVIQDTEDDFRVLDNGYLSHIIIRASKLFPTKNSIPLVGFNLFDIWSYQKE